MKVYQSSKKVYTLLPPVPGIPPDYRYLYGLKQDQYNSEKHNNGQTGTQMYCFCCYMIFFSLGFKRYKWLKSQSNQIINSRDTQHHKPVNSNNKSPHLCSTYAEYYLQKCLLALNKDPPRPIPPPLISNISCQPKIHKEILRHIWPNYWVPLRSFNTHILVVCLY